VSSLIIRRNDARDKTYLENDKIRSIQGKIMAIFSKTAIQPAPAQDGHPGQPWYG
jgi:hypothetical protein